VIQILCPKYLVPVRPLGQVLEQYSVAIDPASGRIMDVLPRVDAMEKHVGASVFEMETHVLLPGLVNMHTHSPMTLLRGYADDLRLDDWLRNHIWPAEANWADGDFVDLGTELAVAEMLRSGTTCFNENYFFPERMADVVEAAGIRACIGVPVIGVETKWAATTEEYLAKGLELVASRAGYPRLRFSIAPHAMYTVDVATLARIADLSERHDMPVHLHLLETESEIRNSQQAYGKMPLHHAEELGLLNERLIAVHMAHLSDSDIDLVARNNVNVVHCPQSNLKLASGVCRLTDLLAAGVNVSIGTDGAASNNDLDMFDELRTAALLAKGLSGDPCVVDAVTALDLVTINAARALGMEHEIGSVEVGKQADLCALDLACARTQPVHHVISQLVYSAASGQVSDVWVAGRQLVKSGELTLMDEARILSEAAAWAVGKLPETHQVRE